MKPLIEKLPLSENTSFIARTYRTPNFEVPWHQHIECELILFIEGEGSSFIGNYVGEFKPGDIFFLGSNLPHTFQKSHPDMMTSAVVVQFREDFWGNDFIRLPETRVIKEVLTIAAAGLKITGESKQLLNSMIRDLEFQTGFQRIIQLCECLLIIAQKKDFETVSTQEVSAFNTRNKERIDKIFQFTIDYFQEPITLSAVAANAGMSVPAFCNYFKKSTKKTYIDFLNEVRVGYACKLLVDTQKKIVDVCYESGFNSIANFNKQFLKVKQLTPSQYKKTFLNSRISAIAAN